MEREQREKQDKKEEERRGKMKIHTKGKKNGRN